jgi:hypothetical protein
LIHQRIAGRIAFHDEEGVVVRKSDAFVVIRRRLDAVAAADGEQGDGNAAKCFPFIWSLLRLLTAKSRPLRIALSRGDRHVHTRVDAQKRSTLFMRLSASMQSRRRTPRNALAHALR